MQQVAASGPARHARCRRRPSTRATDTSPSPTRFVPAKTWSATLTRFRIPNNTIALKIPPSRLYGSRLLVVAPPTVQISGEGLQSRRPGAGHECLRPRKSRRQCYGCRECLRHRAASQCEQRCRHWRWSGPGSPGRARCYRRRKHSAGSRASRRSQMAAGRGLRRRFRRRRIFAGAQASTCHRCGQ